MSILIYTPRLILRPFKLADAKDYYNITRDSEIKKYVSYACPDSISETIENIKSCYSQADFERDFYLIIEEKIIFVINENNISSLTLIKKFSNIEDVTEKYKHVLPPTEKMFCYNNP